MTSGIIQIHVPTPQFPPRLQPFGELGGSEGGGITYGGGDGAGGNGSGDSANAVEATEARTSALVDHCIVVLWAGWRKTAHAAWPRVQRPRPAVIARVWRAHDVEFTEG